jgi:hypothetical protein
MIANLKNLSYTISKNMLIKLGINNLPDFLIIGAQKCGTVALKRYLDQHPDLISARHETSFFSSNYYYKGIDYYKKQFPIRFDRSKLMFEKTPEYIFIPEAPERIYNFNADIKMILLIRDPIKRAFSGWNHLIRYFESTNGYSKQKLINQLVQKYTFERVNDFIDFLNKDKYVDFLTSIKNEIYLLENNISYNGPFFVKRGIYIDQINNYLKYFPKKQLLIIESENFKKNKREYLEFICKFLNINSFNYSKIDLTEYHKSNYKTKLIAPEAHKLLTEYYKLHNEKLFDLLGERFDWD